jgi:hypothetical protein
MTPTRFDPNQLHFHSLYDHRNRADPHHVCFLCPQGRHLMPQRYLFVNIIFYFVRIPSLLARYFVKNAIPLRDSRHGYLKG